MEETRRALRQAPAFAAVCVMLFCVVSTFTLGRNSAASQSALIERTTGEKVDDADIIKQLWSRMIDAKLSKRGIFGQESFSFDDDDPLHILLGGASRPQFGKRHEEAKITQKKSATIRSSQYPLRSSVNYNRYMDD